MLLVADPRPIADLQDLAKRLKHQREARISFEAQRWKGMDGDFVVDSHAVDRGSGGPLIAYMRPRSIKITLRRLGGDERCTARVSAAQPDTRRCVQWHLDSRPVYLEITDVVLH